MSLSQTWRQIWRKVSARWRLKCKTNGHVHLYYNPEHNQVIRDYYLYVVSVFERSIVKTDLRVDAVFGEYPFLKLWFRKLFRIDFQFEHTLVKVGGRGAEFAEMGVVSVLDRTDEMYLIRVDDSERLAGADVIVDYSRPNIVNVASSTRYQAFTVRHFYISPLLYPIEDVLDQRDRDLEVITIFGNPEEPRRKRFLENLKLANLDVQNINGHFDDVRDIYLRTKILLNVRQTEHHHTLEELRVLPALMSGVIVISEDVPLRRIVPYKEFILWAPLSDLPILAAEVQRNYGAMRQKIFGGGNLRKCLIQMEQENLSNAKRAWSRIF